MTGKIYCSAGSSFSIGGMFFKPNHELSKKALSCISSKNLKRLLNDGTLIMEGTEIKKAVPVISPEDTISNRLEPVKKWNVDPLSLVGKDLQHLNIMVLERDPTMAPFETLEEACAQLSKDFKGN